MSRISQLVDSYSKYISVPWRDDAAAAQRVIFCIYNETEELRLRAKVVEFELATKEHGHGWETFDLTDSFAQWLSNEEYKEEYFKSPKLLNDQFSEFVSYVSGQIKDWIDSKNIANNTVVAIMGIGSLFGFMKIKDLVDEISKYVPGRLLIFFPGSYENNNYRLLDGYDGWNYLAVPITPDKQNY